MNRKKVFCFGNEFVKDDSIAKQLADELKINGVEFVKCDNPDDLVEYIQKKADSEMDSNTSTIKRKDPVEEEIVIMDVVKGIKDVMIIDDIDKLEKSNSVTLHDLDLGFYLKLLKEMNMISKIKIIGLPQSGDVGEMKEKVNEILI